MRQEIMDRVASYVQSTMNDQGAGHGWDHVQRVVANAAMINVEVQADKQIVELGALLHDIGDAKFNNGIDKSALYTRSFLLDLNLDIDTINKVVNIVDSISYRKGADRATLSIEAQVVQDADRLDALGVVGIVRAIEYGAVIGRKFYDPNMVINEEMSIEEYEQSTEGTTYGHFYEKLFKLPNLMNTEMGKYYAVNRMVKMKSFLATYIQESSGKI